MPRRQYQIGTGGYLRLQWRPQLHNAHPEGWRDRPGEAPATITRSRARVVLARSSRDRCQLRPTAIWLVGQMRREASLMTAPITTAPRTSTSAAGTLGRLGYASHLSCRECGATFDLGSGHVCTECFGPLEVSYDLPAVTRESIEAGPRNIWRYASLLPVPANVAATPNTEPGWTPLVRTDRLAGAIG